MTAADFLTLLYARVPDGALELTFLAPDGAARRPKTAVWWADMPLVVRDPAMPRVHAMNAQGYGVYFGVTVRAARKPSEPRVSPTTGRTYMAAVRGKEADARWLTALWADSDTPGDAGRNALANFGIIPSVIIRSGGGWHGYWLLREPLRITETNRALIKRTLKGLALACGSDTKVAELARVMRLPGTVNTKPGRDGAPCDVWDALPGRYHYHDLELAFAPLVPAPPAPIHRDMSALAPAAVPRWVQGYLERGASVGERNSTLFRAACDYHNAGLPLFQAERELGARARADGLDDESIHKTIASAYARPVQSRSTHPHHQTMARADHAQRLRAEWQDHS